VRVEVAAVDGTPVWLHLAGPWESDARARTAAVFSGATIAAVLWPACTAVALFAAFLVWNNYRRGRIDRGGAFRLGVFVLLLETAENILFGAHTLEFRSEVRILQNAFVDALFWSVSMMFLYVALEPYIRRRWPELLIAWSRLLTGKWRDPMVGRDVLIGVAAGAAHGMLALASSVVPALLGIRPELFPRTGHVDVLNGLHVGLAYIPSAAITGILFGLMQLVVLVLFAALLRRRSLATAAFFLVDAVLFLIVSHFDGPGIPFYLGVAALTTVLVARIGLLSFVAFNIGFVASFSMPQPVDPTSWAFVPSLVGVLTIAVLAFWSFRVALGDQPAFSGYDD